MHLHEQLLNCLSSYNSFSKIISISSLPLIGLVLFQFPSNNGIIFPYIHMGELLSVEVKAAAVFTIRNVREIPTHSGYQGN